MSTKDMTITQRVEALRVWMKEENFAAFIVPTLDPHNSEYLPDYWKSREWLTGFTGSAGLAIVTLDSAALWTDSRYFLQAEQQLEGTPFELMRQGMNGVPEPSEWLGKHVDDGVIGYYGEVMSVELLESLQEEQHVYHRFSGSSSDPFEAIWTDRPSMPRGAVCIHSEEYAGASVRDKVDLVRQYLASTVGDDYGFFFNDLSQIAWILNVRGNDIAYNPVVVSYLYIHKTGVVWYVDEEKLTAEVKQYLVDNEVAVEDYRAWETMVKKHSEEIKAKLVLSCGMNDKVVKILNGAIVQKSPVEEWRAVKSEAEQAGFRKAMEADGVAMVKFLRWLDEHVGEGNVTEVDVDRQLTALRAEHPDFRSLSFATIAAYGANGAIVHYEAEEATAAILQPHGLLLLDSGAQYAYGTTDITRTISLGETTAEEREAYTLVLKGHIALSRMQFPQGAIGLQLDTAARYAMWQKGYDFGHGTGHGVGAYLSVHEGPMQIRKDYRPNTCIPYCQGVVTSNEPGIYVPGRFGVRIENLLLVQQGVKNAFGSFLCFETLTLCPYDCRPIEWSLLNREEIEWLNEYHSMVRQRLLPLLTDENDRRWLEDATKTVEI